MWRYGHRVTRGHAAKPNIPLTSALDIYRCAKLLIDQHGEDAATHAAKRADALLEDGDMEGSRVWLNIVDAIKELQRTQPRRDEPCDRFTSQGTQERDPEPRRCRWDV